MRFIGVDVGANGALAIINSKGRMISVIDMPSIKIKTNIKVGKNKGKPTTKSVVDQRKLMMFIKNLQDDDILVVERQQPFGSARPGFKRGTTPQADYSLGYQFGLVNGVIETINRKLYSPRPKEWQKCFGFVPKKEIDSKIQSINIATNIFPDANLLGSKGGLKDGRSDALLIAEFGRRMYEANTIDNFIFSNNTTIIGGIHVV